MTPKQLAQLVLEHSHELCALSNRDPSGVADLLREVALLGSTHRIAPRMMSESVLRALLPVGWKGPTCITDDWSRFEGRAFMLYLSMVRDIRAEREAIQ